jgi:hypothetical protein
MFTLHVVLFQYTHFPGGCGGGLFPCHEFKGKDDGTGVQSLFGIAKGADTSGVRKRP